MSSPSRQRSTLARTASVHVLSHFVLPEKARCGSWVDFAGYPTRGEALAAGQSHARWFGSRNKVRRMSVGAFLKLRLPFIQISVPKRGVHA